MFYDVKRQRTGYVIRPPPPLLRRPYFGSNFFAFFEGRALHVCMPTQTSISEITILGIIRMYLEFGWGEGVHATSYEANYHANMSFVTPVFNVKPSLNFVSFLKSTLR
jgi:hypothetical protein